MRVTEIQGWYQRYTAGLGLFQSAVYRSRAEEQNCLSVVQTATDLCCSDLFAVRQLCSELSFACSLIWPCGWSATHRGRIPVKFAQNNFLFVGHDSCHLTVISFRISSRVSSSTSRAVRITNPPPAAESYICSMVSSHRQRWTSEKICFN